MFWVIGRLFGGREGLWGGVGNCVSLWLCRLLVSMYGGKKGAKKVFAPFGIILMGSMEKPMDISFRPGELYRDYVTSPDKSIVPKSPSEPESKCITTPILVEPSSHDHKEVSGARVSMDGIGVPVSTGVSGAPVSMDGSGASGSTAGT